MDVAFSFGLVNSFNIFQIQFSRYSTMRQCDRMKMCVGFGINKI